MARAKTKYDHHSVTLSPSVEPVSTADMKAWLRVDYSSDDTLIDDLVKSARIEVERITGRALITQAIAVHYLQYGEKVRLPLLPVQTIDSVKQKVNDQSTTLTVDSDYYVQGTSGTSDKYIEMSSPANPITGTSPLDNTSNYHLEVAATVGYGDAATDIPADFIRAIKVMVTDMYEQRQDNVIGTITSQMQDNARKMLRQYINYM